MSDAARASVARVFARQQAAREGGVWAACEVSPTGIVKPLSRVARPFDASDQGRDLAGSRPVVASDQEAAA